MWVPDDTCLLTKREDEANINDEVIFIQVFVIMKA